MSEEPKQDEVVVPVIERKKGKVFVWRENPKDEEVVTGPRKVPTGNGPRRGLWDQ